MDSATITSGVADYVVSAQLSVLSPDVLDQATKVAVDTFGVMIAGTTGDLAGPLLTYVRARPDGPARVVGWEWPTDRETAALANGTLGHALDYDDVLTMMPGHPSAVVLGALLALEGIEKLDGRRFLEAYIVGVEVGARVGRAIGLGHYNHGWHATGTLGIFAGVAGVAKALGLERPVLQTALGIAGSLASGMQWNFGTMTKPLHSGWAARSAIVAVDLARAGWTANDDIFNAEKGFIAVYGDAESRPAAVLEPVGTSSVFADPGIALKKFPCCYAVHRAIDAVQKLRRSDGTAGLPEKIACRVPPPALRPLLYSRPVTGLQGKFSLEYNIAAAMLDGEVTLASFHDEAVARPEIRQLLERIEIKPDPECTVVEGGAKVTAGSGGFIEVTATWSDGTVNTEKVVHAPGSPQRGLTWEEVDAKFVDCAKEAGVDEAVAESVLVALHDLSSANVPELIARLRVPET